MTRYRHAVIISSYNRPKMVREAIQSALFQRASVQILIADDDSNEETRRAIEDEIRGHANCQVLYANRPRSGEFTNIPLRATSCINDALALVDAEFVHYLPDDDLFGSARFWAFEHFFDENPEADVAYGVMFTVDGSDEAVGEVFVGTTMADAVNWVDHGQFCHRRRVLERVPRWPAEPHYAFDANFLSALTAAGYVFHPVDHVVNYKRVHEHNLMGERDRSRIIATRES